MTVYLTSFGFKHGPQPPCQFLFDARLLANPYWEPSLRSFNGKDAEIIDFFKQQPQAIEYLQHITRFLEKALPMFYSSKEQDIHIAIGCTGGQHRSVYLVEQLAQHLITTNISCQITHRDL